MTPLATLTLAGCLAASPNSGQITAGELAGAIPGFRAPLPEIPVGWAPAPGVTRIFRVDELRRLAKRLGWEVEPAADICVERPVAPPDPQRFLAAMRNALPQAGIDILEYGRQPVPEGAIEFPASGLHAGPAGAMWIGWVRYGGARRFAIWARVRVAVAAPRVIAVGELRPGRAISSEEVRAETREEFPQPQAFLASAAEAVGKWPRVPIHAGSAILAGMLETPKDVMRGDTVAVEVRNGAARLELEAQAEGSGAVGETIAVRNPSSNKRFRARVEGKGRVSVALPPDRMNP